VRGEKREEGREGRKNLSYKLVWNGRIRKRKATFFVVNLKNKIISNFEEKSIFYVFPSNDIISL